MQARGSCRDEYGIPSTDHAAQRALVIGPEVEGESALGLLGLVEPDEVQSRGAVRAQADLALVSRGGDHHPAERVSPPLSQGLRTVSGPGWPPPFTTCRGTTDSEAGADEVLVSSTTADLVVGSNLSFEDAGTHHLKGIDSPTRILRYRPAA
jgi:hypothetical protein